MLAAELKMIDATLEQLTTRSASHLRGVIWHRATIVMVRMRSKPRTDVVRRTAEGMSNKEIQRCLKRYVVREIYPLILMNLTAATDIS